MMMKMMKMCTLDLLARHPGNLVFSLLRKRALTYFSAVEKGQLFQVAKKAIPKMMMKMTTVAAKATAVTNLTKTWKRNRSHRRVKNTPHQIQGMGITSANYHRIITFLFIANARNLLTATKVILRKVLKSRKNGPKRNLRRKLSPLNLRKSTRNSTWPLTKSWRFISSALNKDKYESMYTIMNEKHDFPSVVSRTWIF